jgi:hypothetical protein
MSRVSSLLVLGFAIGFVTGAALMRESRNKWFREGYAEGYETGRVETLANWRGEHSPDEPRPVEEATWYIEKDAILVFPNRANVQVIGVTDAEFGARCNPPGRYYVCVDSYRWITLMDDLDVLNDRTRIVYRGNGNLPLLRMKDIGFMFGCHCPKADAADMTRFQNHVYEH